MKKKIMKALSVMLAVVLTLTAAPLSGFVGFEVPEWLNFSIMSSAAETSGTCGENLTWSFDEETGTLTISGTGAMYDFDYDYNWTGPWEYLEDRITEVVIEDGVTTIGERAFSCCGNLTSVTIGDSVTTIGIRAFESCYSLTSITIPDSVTTIGNYAFKTCDSLTSVTIGDGVTTIGACAFQWCENLINVIIPNNVTSIGDGAFYDCYSLTNVTIPDSVTTIGDEAFGHCEQLTNITIPDSVTSIGYGVFWGCCNLEKLRIPSYDYGLEAFDLIRCPSKITLYDSEILLEFTKGDQTTIVEIGNDVQSFDIFSTVLPACGPVEDIILHEDNDSFKLVDGVLYNSDITELCLYPTASEMKEYIMPDTVVWEFATLKYYDGIINGSTPDSAEFCGGPLCSVNNAINLEKLSYGKSYRYCMTDDMINLFNEANDCKTEEEKIAHLLNTVNSVAEYTMYSWFLENNLKKFSVHDENPYFTSKSGVLYFKQDDYKIALKSMIKSIDYLKIEKNEIYSEHSLALNKINTLEFTDDYIEDFHSLLGEDFCSLFAWSFACSSVGSYVVPENNDYLTSVDGILYSKDEKILVAFPLNSTRNIIVIPETIEYIGEYAFGEAGASYYNVNQNITIHISKKLCDLLTDFEILLFSFDSVCFEDEETLVEIFNGEINSIDEYNAAVDEFNAEMQAELDERLNEMYIEYGEDLDTYNKFAVNAAITTTIKGYDYTLANGTICEGVHCKHEYKMTEHLEATCVETGYSIYVCSLCGESYTIYESVSATGHSYDSVVTAPTCTENGYTTYTCSLCGDKYIDDETNALKHKWAFDDAVEADCINDGLTQGVSCKVCNEILIEQNTIPATGHNYESVITAPTCTENGYTTYTCSACGDSYVSDETGVLGHTEVEILAVAPTCTMTGLSAGVKCSVCNEVLTEQTTIPATGHTPASAVEENYIAPTCTSNGSVDKVVYCSVCNAELSRTTETIEMLGHADNDGNGYCDADNELLDPTVECDCNCHKSGIKNFFFKFALFFQRIFGANKTCACGVSHY